MFDKALCSLLDISGLGRIRLDYCGFCWILVDSAGLMWIRLIMVDSGGLWDSAGLLWIRLDSGGFDWISVS